MKATAPKPTKAIARKVLALVDHGLVAGLGKPEPGQMCVEAAVNYAFGLPHGDEPPCVGTAVRAFKIKLNDCYWPSPQARAEGMRELSIAQLGSDTLDQMAFGKLMYLRGVQKLLPFVWRKEAKRLSSTKKAKMLSWCEKMEAVETFEQALEVAKAASACACSYACASAYAYACASASASACAYAYACASAYACAYAYAYDLLKLTAQVGVDVLKELKSPGCRWLDLCKEARP